MPKAIPGRVSTQLRLEETAHYKSKIIAEKECRPLNSQFEYFIIKGVERFEKENGPIPLPDDKET